MADAPDGVEDHLTRRTLMAGDTLFEHGQPAEGLWWIERGSVALCTPDARAPIVVGAGTVLDRLDWELDGLRTRTARAVSACTVLWLADDDRPRVASAHPALARWLAQPVERHTPGVRAALRGVFGALAPARFDTLIAGMAPLWRRGGESLCEQGDEADGLYLIVVGRVDIRVRGADGEERSVAHAGRGELLGERALLTGEPRVASLVALRDTKVLCLSQHSVDALLGELAGPVLPFLRTLAGRMEGSVRSRSGGAETVALVPLHPTLDVLALARALSSELPGTVQIVDAAHFEQVHGAGSASRPADDRSVRWLHAQEEAHDWLLYVVRSQPEAWTLRSVRQSDQVVLLADGRQPPGRTPNDALVDELAQVTPALVVVHPSDADVPRGTGERLAARPGIGRHLHLLRGHAADLARLARRVARREVSVVLGGGGARGFAHLGLLRAFQEAGLPIDGLGCTSMGAGIGAGLALGMETEAVLAGLERVFVGTRFHRSFTVPFVSVLSAARIEPLLEELGQGRHVEDTWLPFFACATNLTRSRLEVVERGPLAWAVRASCALPAVLPPAVRAGELFVDGGLLDNLPVASMRARSEGVVIAVDVSPSAPLQVDPAWRRMPDGGAVLWRRLDPFSPRTKMPSIADIVLHSLTCTGERQRQDTARSADVVLTPPVEAYGTMDMDRCGEIAEVGYRYGQEQCAAVQRVLDEVGR